MRFDEIDGDVVEEPSRTAAAVRAANHAGTLGFGDELQAGLEHYFPRLALTPGEFFDPSVPTPAAQTYTRARDNARAVNAVTHEEHPYISNAVEFGTSLVHPLNKVGGKGLIGAMKGGALQGAVQGLGDSRADLTDGDIENYARAFQDTSNGANYGAAFGAIGHGVGQGVRGLGRSVGRVIDDARESLFREEAERGARELAEADAPRIAQREAEAAKAVKERAAIDKAHGDALQKNKEMNARAAKEAEREAQRADALARREMERLEREHGRALEMNRSLDGREAAAEAQAQRQAEMDAAREAERLERAHGQALQMNKAAEARQFADQARAARQAEQQARRAAERLEQQHGVALEMNKRPSQRGGARRGGAPALTEEPGTRTLGGYKGSAGERRAVNFDRVQAYRERMADPNLGEAERGRLQQYIDAYGDAVDNPGAFERRRIEQELRKNYPRDMVDRIMAERVGPDGAIRSRGETPTVAADLSDFQKNGWAERGPRVGGGGSAWEGGYTPRSERPTEIIPLERSEDVTKAGLVRVNAEGGEPLKYMDDMLLHSFEFTPKGSNQRFAVEVLTDPANPDVVNLDIIRPAGADIERLSVDQMHDLAANSVGPSTIKQIMQELARHFPNAKRLVADRVTGWSPGREINMRLPEVTRPGVPDFPLDPTVRVEMPTEPPPPESFDLPPMEEVTNPGQPTFPSEAIAGFSPIGARPQPRAAAANYWDFSDKAPAAVHEAPTKGGPSAPVDAPPPAAPTVAGFRPQASEPVAPPTPQQRAPTLSPEPIASAAPRAEVGPQGPPRLPLERPVSVGRPSSAPYAPTSDEAKVYEYLRNLEGMDSAAMQRAQSREAGAGKDIRAAFMGGAKNWGIGGGILGGPVGGMKGAILGGLWGVGKEAIRNPAVRARALSALRLRRLASVDPETWGRVGRALEQALQQGPEEYAAAVHVYNQTDPGFREAQRKTAEGLEDMDDARLEQELRAAGLL